MLREFARKAVGAMGYATVRPIEQTFPEATDYELGLMAAADTYTLTSKARRWSVITAVKYVHARKVPGAFVETGVWRGGCGMIAASMFMHLGDSSRELWLYDTYEGMPEPTASDVKVHNGENASVKWSQARTGTDSSSWCMASLEDVRNTMSLSCYPPERIRYIQGKTQETLLDVANRPRQIAILRLDTDWYESTSAELEALFDQVSPGGVVIFDDYGHWAGAKQAVDEFFSRRPETYLFNRVDYTCRVIVKA